MNEIVKSFEGINIRIVEHEDGIWFVAKDVCSYFGENNYRRALGNLDQDEKGVSQMNTPGGRQKLLIVNESGLYGLLFAMQPKRARGVTKEYVQKRQEKLRLFKRWVTHDVLPSIRKTGAYLAPNISMEKLQNLIETIGEQYKLLIESNSILRQQLEYATQFVPKTKYGSTSPANGQRRTTIRRGANVAGNGRLIEKRDPEEVGYQMDLFGEYLPQIIFTNAVNFITNSNVKQLECCHA